jgi:hypothetical protein
MIGNQSFFGRPQSKWQWEKKEKSLSMQATKAAAKSNWKDFSEPKIQT